MGGVVPQSEGDAEYRADGESFGKSKKVAFVSQQDTLRNTDERRTLQEEVHSRRKGNCNTSLSVAESRQVARYFDILSRTCRPAVRRVAHVLMHEFPCRFVIPIVQRCNIRMDP